MAQNKGSTALQTVMQGGKVSEKQAQSALGQAVDKIAGLTKRAKEGKEAMVETGTLVLHTAETQGSLFLSSMAEGYFGPDKLKIGSVDIRAPLGLLAQGYGLYETMSGRKGGGHALALGNGVMGSWLASVAMQAGRVLAEKRNAAAQPQQQPAPTPVVTMTPAVQGQRALPGPSLLPEPSVNGPVREVLLTPSAEGDEFEGRRGRRRRRAPQGHPVRRAASRFVRAELERDDDTDEFDDESED